MTTPAKQGQIFQNYYKQNIVNNICGQLKLSLFPQLKVIRIE